MNATTQSVPIAPERLLVLGHIPSLLRKRLRFLEEQQAHGDIVKLYLGRAVYLINSPDLIRQVLVTDADKFDRGRLFEKARNFLGTSMFNLDGEPHRRQRRIILPAFHRNRIAAYTEIIDEQVIARVSAWQPGEAFNFENAMAQLSLTIVIRTLFGERLSKQAESDILHALLVLIKGVITRVLLPDFWEKVPTPGNRRFNDAQSRLRKAIDNMVASYRAADTDRGDLMSALVSARYDDTNEPMSAEQIRAEIVGILMAGTETTTLTLSWLFYELSQHPDVEQRLHNEIDTVLDGKPITFADIPALEYTNHVIMETLRRRNPLWFVLRRAVESVDLGGFQIPAGAAVLYSLTALHRDPTLYPEPLRFDPDRWLSKPVSELPKGAFIPFSVGAQKCIGDHFAMTEMAIIVATIASRWSLVPAAGNRVREKVLATVHPGNLIMSPVPRRHD